MTLLFMDGFSELGTRMDPNWISQTTWAQTTGRDGSTNGAAVANINNPAARAFTPSATVVAGIAAFQSTLSATLTNDGCLVFAGDTNAVVHLTVVVVPGGAIQLWRGPGFTTLLASTANGLIPLSTWHYIEAKATIADSGGNCEVKLDGATVINFTGDTRNGGTSTNIDTIRCLGSNGTRGVFDDMYVLNTLGSAPYNDFLGDVKIVRLLPNGNGATNQFLGSDGNSTDNYLLVDETPPSTTDYVGSSNPGDRDLYEMTNLPTSGLVYATQPVYWAAKSDAGSRLLKPIQRSSGGTVAASTSVGMSTSYMLYTGDLRTTDPAGAALTVANTNGQQVGAEVV